MEIAPFELAVGEDGIVVLPLSILAQVGIDPGSTVLAVPAGDGRLVLRRLADATDDLLTGRFPG